METILAISFLLDFLMKLKWVGVIVCSIVAFDTAKLMICITKKSKLHAIVIEPTLIQVLIMIYMK